MNKNDIILCLEKLNFSKLESQIYLELLDHGKMSAYQLGKKIEIARTSIYNALEHMMNKGMIEIIDGETAKYIAKEPEVLLKKLKEDFEENATTAQDYLNRFASTSYDEEYANIKGIENIVYKVKQIIHLAKEEIYINLDFDLKYILDDILEASNRGIKVIIFSFYDVTIPNCEGQNSNIVVYSHKKEYEKDYIPGRLIVVVDNTMVIIADNNKERNVWHAIVTNNGLMIKIASEHIHNDIYLLKLRESFPDKKFPVSTYIHTNFEDRALRWNILRNM